MLRRIAVNASPRTKGNDMAIADLSCFAVLREGRLLNRSSSCGSWVREGCPIYSGARRLGDQCAPASHGTKRQVLLSTTSSEENRYCTSSDRLGVCRESKELSLLCHSADECECDTASFLGFAGCAGGTAATTTVPSLSFPYLKLLRSTTNQLKPKPHCGQRCRRLPPSTRVWR